MKNYFTGLEEHTSNRNVPEDAEIIGRVSYCSGEITYTYYCRHYNPAHSTYGHWALWKVCDWVDSQPELTNFTEMLELGLVK